jgi:hypothetical protein
MMVKPSSRDVVERFVRAIENKDFDALERPTATRGSRRASP